MNRIGLNKQRRYTILLSESNNHFDVILQLKEAGLILEHSASTDDNPIYILERELMKDNFIDELIQLYGDQVLSWTDTKNWIRSYSCRTSKFKPMTRRNKQRNGKTRGEVCLKCITVSTCNYCAAFGTYCHFFRSILTTYKFCYAVIHLSLSNFNNIGIPNFGNINIFQKYLNLYFCKCLFVSAVNGLWEKYLKPNLGAQFR